MANLQLTAEDLKPLVQAALAEVLASDLSRSERLAYDENEAAQLLGCAKHILRGARLRGELQGKRIGKKMHYSRHELLRFLGVDRKQR